MIAKLTSENQLNSPESIVSEFEGIEYFDIAKESGRLVLTPEQLTGIERVWQKIEERGITDQDIADAVKWAREDK